MMVTLAPLLTNSFATSFPMPFDPPLTRTCFPFKELLSFEPGSKERLERLQLLTLKGDFRHNKKVLQQGCGYFVVKRRCLPNRDKLIGRPHPNDHEHYTPCVFCLAFVSLE